MLGRKPARASRIIKACGYGSPRARGRRGWSYAQQFLIQFSNSLPVIASHPVGAKRRRMTGSTKQSRVVCGALDYRVHRISQPTSVTIAKLPSCGCETGERIALICPTTQSQGRATDWHDGQFAHDAHAPTPSPDQTEKN